MRAVGKSLKSLVHQYAITERSGDKIRRETIAAKIEIPEEEPSVIEKLNTVASNRYWQWSKANRGMPIVRVSVMSKFL